MKDMKKILLWLLIPCFIGIGIASGFELVGSGVAAVGGSYLINEGFEDTGTPSSWTAGGNGINYDYTTYVKSGSESLNFVYVSGGDLIVSTPTFTEQSDIYIAFPARANALPASSNTFWVYIYNSSSQIQAEVRTGPDGYLRAIATGAVGGNSSAGELPTDAFKYIKAHYVAGSGSDSSLTVYTSSDGSSWGQVAQSTGGTGTTAIDHVGFIVPSATTGDYIIDDIRISASDINY